MTDPGSSPAPRSTRDRRRCVVRSRGRRVPSRRPVARRGCRRRGRRTSGRRSSGRHSSGRRSSGAPQQLDGPACAGGALGAAPGHAAARRPPLLPPGHAIPGLGLVAAAAGPSPAHRRVRRASRGDGGRRGLRAAGLRRGPRRPARRGLRGAHRPVAAALPQRLADRRHPLRLDGVGGRARHAPRVVLLGPGAPTVAAPGAVHAARPVHPRGRHRAVGGDRLHGGGREGLRTHALLRLAAAGGAAHDAAAVRRGGVRLPRLPQPGDRGLDPLVPGSAPWWPRW